MKPYSLAFSYYATKLLQVFHKRFICYFILFNAGFSTITEAQCIAPDLVFANPVLISGTDGQVGAQYLFPKVAPGIDAHILILGLQNGAELGEIDNTTQGYYDAWQPYVTAGPMGESYLEWRITFKKEGTNTDTILPCLAVTAVDIDGDNKLLQEFVEAATPGAYAIDPFTSLTVTFDGVRTKAIGQTTTVMWIDTAARHAMFQMNFTNVSQIDYRNGAITTSGNKDVRHTCIYFKPFFTDLTTLPVHLLSFNAVPRRNENTITWTVADERDLIKYTIQRSTDGVTWKDITTVWPNNNGAPKNSYTAFDYETAGNVIYYRLKYQYKNSSAYSSIVVVRISTGLGVWVTAPTLLQGSSVQVQLQSSKTSEYRMDLTSMLGQTVGRSAVQVQAGSHLLQLPFSVNLTNGIYLLTVKDAAGRVVATKKLVKQS